MPNEWEARRRSLCDLEPARRNELSHFSIFRTSFCPALALADSAQAFLGDMSTRLTCLLAEKETPGDALCLPPSTRFEDHREHGEEWRRSIITCPQLKSRKQGRYLIYKSVYVKKEKKTFVDDYTEFRFQCPHVILSERSHSHLLPTFCGRFCDALIELCSSYKDHTASLAPRCGRGTRFWPGRCTERAFRF